VSKREGAAIELLAHDRLTRVTTRIADATRLTPAELSAHVEHAYREVLACLHDLQAHPVRFWNYVPAIGQDVGEGMDRYMAFNRGRYAAYCNGTGGVPGQIPTASAVGIAGNDLVIDCLASQEAGTQIENPRQINPWHYSRRYGPQPPCFARATIATLSSRRMLLIGGTASIVGEESRHAGNTQAQVEEIVANLEALIREAAGNDQRPLARLRDLRIYVVNAGDAEFVQSTLRNAAGREVHVECAIARVCRPELLVEVEGVAAL
jgi:chorismate lyase / 3-hydroxybenzoate synthase